MVKTITNPCPCCRIIFSYSYDAHTHRPRKLCSKKCANKMNTMRGLNSIKDRFLKSTNKTKKCWLWVGGIFKVTGYGVAHAYNKNISAHRLSWTIFKGTIPKGSFVLHKCDVRNCVNPKHLFLGSSRDNINDMLKKKRHNFGIKHPMCKLTEKQVIKIRSLISEGYSSPLVAKKFNLDRNTPREIFRRKTWKHIK